MRGAAGGAMEGRLAVCDLSRYKPGHSIFMDGPYRQVECAPPIAIGHRLSCDVR